MTFRQNSFKYPESASQPKGRAVISYEDLQFSDLRAGGFSYSFWAVKVTDCPFPRTVM